MSERYTELFVLPEQVAPEEGKEPVAISAGALRLDNESGKVFAQIKYQNVSAKSIKKMKVTISANDKMGVKISGVNEFVYEGLIAGSGDYFGAKTPVVMSDNNAHSFAVEVTFVEFSDGSVWSKFGQEVADAAAKAANVTKDAVGKVVKHPFEILALIVNCIFSFFFVGGTIVVLFSAGSWATAQDTVANLFLVLLAVVTFPGFGRVMFRGEYGRKQRVLRWVIAIGLFVIDQIIMAMFFN